jgi:lipopolysaccharide/colanic/teichoic acid biosynthesis glycosyltransferase
MRKRVFDLFWSALGLGILTPVLLLIALAIRLEDGGPAFFRQIRVGRGGRTFRIWKFRTMSVDAENRGRSITVGDDPRITRVGRLLRAAKLDELPQLLNVLSGEMSLVGPRPEVPKYVALYDESERPVLDLRPGITDLASIKYRHEGELLARSPDPDGMYVKEILPDKIRINLNYAAWAGLWTDFLVILATLGLYPIARIQVPGREERIRISARRTD